MTFDPSIGKYTYTLGDDPGKGRKSGKLQDIALLPNGEVLITGGLKLTGENIGDLAAIYNPIADTFRVGAVMNILRKGHRTTLLENGKVLITGGKNAGGTLVKEAEIYIHTDSLGSFDMCAGGFNIERDQYTATLLSDGRVLIIGGKNSMENALSSLEIYNQSTDSFSMPDVSLNTPRAYHTATMLADGSVLIAGGKDENGIILSNAEIYIP